jgi:hypothetical protein
LVEIKSVDEIAEKWKRVTPGRSADYEAGIKNPRKSWEDGAIDAEGAYQAGVQDAINRKAFSGGIRNAGNAKWQRKSLDVGVGRFGPGVQAAGEDMKKGIAPFVDTIRGVSLPDRKAKGDPGNIDRVRILADALHKKKLAIQAGGG